VPALAPERTITDFTMGVTNSSRLLSINAPSNKEIVRITNDGDVIWYGKPSEAIKTLTTCFHLSVEAMAGVNKGARKKYQYHAYKNILKKSQSMTKKQLISDLTRIVKEHEEKIIMDTLTNVDK